MALSKGFLTEYVSILKKIKLHGDVLMLGNQESRITKDDFKNTLNRLQIFREIGENLPNKLTCEHIFNIMGARSYTDVDLFGNAKLKLDLAKPFPDTMRNKYDFVCDIGTIEHVINPLQVLENIVCALKKTGTVFLFNPAKISLNHGYYTLQPQLFSDFFLKKGFRVLTQKLLVYWGNYDSNLFLLFSLPYGQQPWNLEHHSRGKPLCVRTRRRLHRFLSDYSRGCLNLFVAIREQQTPSHQIEPIVQRKFSQIRD